MSRIAILGAGAWGTALAVSLARRGGHSISLWAHSPEHAEALTETGVNARYLPGYVIPMDVRVTSKALDAVAGADVILCVVPSQTMRSVVKEFAHALNPKQILLSASKGVEEKTFSAHGPRCCASMRRRNPIGVLSGPSFAQEVAAGQPTALTLACHDPKEAQDEEILLKSLQDDFTSASLRVYRNDDIIGTELGGALKNVIALASGVVTGLELGANAQAALITRGMAEITRLSVACGGRRDTLSGLAGVGDLVLTCTGTLSRNRAVGIELGSGRKLPDILAALKGKVAEGVHSTTAALGLAPALRRGDADHRADGRNSLPG